MGSDLIFFNRRLSEEVNTTTTTTNTNTILVSTTTTILVSIVNLYFDYLDDAHNVSSPPHACTHRGAKRRKKK